MLGRALAAQGLPDDRRPWLDLAPLAGALVPEAYRYGGRSLDDWLAAFGIECAIRHNAAADALATAELLLRLRALGGEAGHARIRGAGQGGEAAEVARLQRLTVAPAGVARLRCAA